MTLLLLLLLMTGAPATPCGCKEANDINTDFRATV